MLDRKTTDFPEPVSKDGTFLLGSDGHGLYGADKST